MDLKVGGEYSSYHRGELRVVDQIVHLHHILDKLGAALTGRTLEWSEDPRQALQAHYAAMLSSIAATGGGADEFDRAGEEHLGADMVFFLLLALSAGVRVTRSSAAAP